MNFRKQIAGVMVIISILCMTACQNPSASENTVTDTKTDTNTITTASENTEKQLQVETTEFETAKDKSYYCGTWSLTSVSSGGITATIEALEKNGNYKFSGIVLILNDIGKYYFGNMKGGEIEYWTVTENGINADGDDLILENELLVLYMKNDEKLFFEKTSADMILPETPSDSTEETTTAPLTGIRPEFKATMDSYEAFFDEYTDFMNRYATADYADMLAMMTDYTNYLTKYTEAMQKLNEIDENELSNEELAYYLEVTARINSKLMQSVQ